MQESKSSITTFNNTRDREITITRLIDAPCELVWDAMTKPEHVVHWWGPNGFTNTLEKMDFRVSGEWRHIMHGPDGQNYPSRIVYTEINKPHRIELSYGGTYKGDPNAIFEATWTFDEVDGKTKVTIYTLFATAEIRDRKVKENGAIEGGNQTLARLANYVAKS